MQQLTPAFIDFETFWDVKYTLKSLSITDYVFDPRFAVHGASVAIGQDKPQWLTGSNLYEWLHEHRSCMFVGHHALFDGFVATVKYECTYPEYFCTMGLIEALFQGATGRGLDEAMTSLLRWSTGKSDILKRTKGKYWDQFTISERQEMAEYANYDLEAEQQLFYTYACHLPKGEWQVMSNMLKMFCRPRLVFNETLLREALATAHQEREEEIEVALNLFGCTEADLKGNNSFAELLASCNYEMPMKPSPSVADKKIPALAKTDQAFQDMLESDDPRVAALARGRQAVKSTQGITRAQRFVNLHEVYGKLPAAYNYYRAHTGRPTGANKINVTNLKRSSLLRECIEAPNDYVLGVADSSQIECRSNGYLAGQQDLLDLFAAHGDPYNDMASDIFNRPIQRKFQDEHGNYPDFLEGWIGKTAVLGLGYQMAGLKFALTVKVNAKIQLGMDYEIELDEAYRIVDVYRRKNWCIKAAWDRAEEWLYRMVQNDQPFDFYYADGALHIDPPENKIWFPNGTYLFFPCLDYQDGSFTYVNRLGSKYVNRYLYGGKLIENIVQKFSRDIVVWQMNKIAEEKEVVLHTYDENVALFPAATAEEDMKWMLQIMKTAPPWATSLPLDAEGGYAKEYSK